MFFFFHFHFLVSPRHSSYNINYVWIRRKKKAKILQQTLIELPFTLLMNIESFPSFTASSFIYLSREKK